MSTPTVSPATGESNTLIHQSLDLLSDAEQATLKDNKQAKQDSAIFTGLFEPFATNWSNIVTKA